MHICILSGVIARSGGTERMACWLANQLAQKGYQVSLLSYWDHGHPYYLVDEAVSVQYLLNPKKEGKLFRTKLYPYFKMKKWLQKEKVDVLVEVDTIFSKSMSSLLKRLNIVEIGWEHFHYHYQTSQKQRLKKNQSYVVTLTQRDRQQYINEGGFDEEKVVCIPNPAMFNPSNEYHHDAHCVLYVGRFTKQKNLFDLLQAWSTIETDWTLQLVGDGEDKETIQAFIKEKELTNVSILPTQKDVTSFYKKASLFVLSSIYEGLPMVLVEAASFGLPCVSYDCPTGPAEIIQDGQTGFLVEVGQIEQLAERIKYLMDHPTLAQQFSTNAKAYIQTHFAQDVIVKQWVELLERIKNK